MRQLVLFLVIMLALSSGAMASATPPASTGNGDNFSGCETDIDSVNVNESLNICPGEIRRRMSEGRDPPPAWISRGGTGESSQSGASEMGGEGMISTGLKTAREAVPPYQGEGCWYSNNNTMEGGESYGGASDACESFGDGGQSAGPPESDLMSLISLPTNLMSCLGNVMNAVRTNVSGGCVSARVNFCGLGSTGGNTCVGANGVRVNGSAAMTGVQSLNIKGGESISPASSINGDPLASAIRGPVSVAGNSLLELPDGQMVTVAAKSVITTTTDNWIQVRDETGVLVKEFNLNDVNGAAKLTVPPEGVDVDPGIFNANNYQ